ALQDRMVLLLKLKAVYDWSVLADVLDGHEYLSDAKVATYEQHKNDLKVLRAVFRKYAPNEYNKMFRSDKEKYNYCAYTGHPSKKGEAVVDKRNVLQEDFCKFALKLLGDFTPATPAETDLKAKLQAGTALPKQATKDNSVLPYQIHLRELQVILDHSKQHYTFLNTEQDGTTVADKIIKLMTFRIPYYVGPLNPTHGNAWIVRKETGKIYPWNFDDKVDKIKSAEQFIQRMTNFCTYLVGEKVLPKESVLYSKFVIYNQLNSIAVDGQKLPPALKNALFQDLFLQTDRAQKVTVKRIQNYLVSKGYCEKSAEITGLDGEVRGTMKSYIELRKILGDKVNDTQMTEEIIYQITVLGESKKLMQVFLQRTFGDRLSAEEMHNLLRLNYSGWGNLSETFLTGIYHMDKATGEAVSILSALENTTDNLMQLLSGKYGFTDAVNLFNADKNGQITAANAGQAVDELAVSPAVKRSIRRTLAVIKEVTKVMGHAPKRIFLEVARGPAESQKNQRTQSRKQALLDCYAACKREESALFEALDKATEDTLRKDKLYLYYTQLGRCMYSGEPIDLADLLNDKNNYNKYDIDHIYPQSKTKDDSLQNRVLVQRVLNEEKGDTYPVPSSMRNAKTIALWKHLLDLNLISKEKYYRLMRTTPLSVEELAGFIARQLVETRQSSKATAQLLAQLYPNSEVVYSKAKNVSEFRTEFKFDKCRSVNDYHHAKDAYLNIVVGNVYHVKFTNNPVRFLKSGEDYSLKCVFKHPVQRGGETAWLPDGSYIATVRKTMAKNNILFTRYATEQKGAFFDQQPVKKGSGQMPLKTGDPRLADFQKYGGYNSVKGAYFVLVRHTLKGKSVKTFEFVPVYKAKYFEQHPEALLPYFAETLQDPEILLPKVKINTLFSVDGFKMHLSGRTGSQLVFRNANQLVLSEQQYAYFHRIDKWIEQNKKAKSIQPISYLRNLTKEDNLEIYDTLYQKLCNTVYSKKLSAQKKNLEQCREKFLQLSLEEQCIFLSNILKMFQCNSSTADLKLCGGGGDAGKVYLSSNITKFTDIKLIFQSVTGLFENELDLASL
ncbi:MAG: type II CRISPR RNA-guided endonuclease Cas9, partial [Candidatus Fimenecus sp.]